MITKIYMYRKERAIAPAVSDQETAPHPCDNKGWTSMW